MSNFWTQSKYQSLRGVVGDGASVTEQSTAGALAWLDIHWLKLCPQRHGPWSAALTSVVSDVYQFTGHMSSRPLMYVVTTTTTIIIIKIIISSSNSSSGVACTAANMKLLSRLFSKRFPDNVNSTFLSMGTKEGECAFLLIKCNPLNGYSVTMNPLWT